MSYNVKYFLEQCLSSVYEAIRQLHAEVWVVDNASSDNSIDYLRPKFSWVNFIENEENLGFSRANNLALYKCSGKYILYLNPDTIIPENCLVNCIAFMEANTNAGALGIRMIDGRGFFLSESKRSFPSPLTSFYKLIGLSTLFPSSSVFSRYALGHLDQYQNHEVDVLSGAFMMVKKEVLTELKGFDEAFFMYGEDIDLSYRIQKMGYKNYYFSESTIIHFKGESTKKKSLKYVKIFYEAMSIFVKKHYSGRSASFNAFFLHFAIWSRAAVSVVAQFGSKAGIFISGRINNFLRGKKEHTGSKKHQQAIIVGNEEEYNEVKTLLAQAKFTGRIIGRVSTRLHDEKALGDPNKLNKLIESLEATEVIFCRGSDLDYLSIINKIEELAGKVSMHIHGKGTTSIVGSDSKETSGFYLLMLKIENFKNGRNRILN